MTNAEKLAKDTDFMALLIIDYKCRVYNCNYCPLGKNPDCLDRKKIKKWLESEAKEE